MATMFDRELESGFDREILHELQSEFEGGSHFEDELSMALEGGGLHEDEFEFEFEAGGEQFFGKIARGIGRFAKKAAPVLGQIAKVAVPIVANAVAPGVGGMIADTAMGLLGEEEWEDELIHELGGVHEGHLESVMHEGHPEAVLHELGEHAGEFEGIAHEGHPEAVLHELGEHAGEFEGIAHEGHAEHAQELLAEVMAEAAAGAHLEAEAEAMAGAAVVTALSPADRAALRALIPHLVMGAAVLTRLLRRRRITRPAVRTVPSIVRQTAKVLRRRAASGAPVGRKTAGKVMGMVTRKVLGNPRTTALAIAKNVRSSMRHKRSARRVSG
jgi:hypothetical protein